LREKFSFGNSDVGVRCNQGLFLGWTHSGERKQIETDQ
jgi:hypothetical protein